jgi:hypothetical protein
MDVDNVQRDIEDDLDEEDIIIQAATTAVMAVAFAAINYMQTYYDKVPYYDSALSGAAWVFELLNGHLKRIRKELGVQNVETQQRKGGSVGNYARRPVSKNCLL